MGRGITICEISENEQLIEETLLIVLTALSLSLSQQIGLQEIFLIMQLLFFVLHTQLQWNYLHCHVFTINFVQSALLVLFRCVPLFWIFNEPLQYPHIKWGGRRKWPAHMIVGVVTKHCARHSNSMYLSLFYTNLIYKRCNLTLISFFIYST